MPITLKSKKSNVASAKLTDYRIPAPPDIDEARWNDNNDGLIVSITTDEIAKTVSVEYRYGDELAWKKVKLMDEGYWQDSNLITEIDIPFQDKNLKIRALSKNASSVESKYSKEEECNA